MSQRAQRLLQLLWMPGGWPLHVAAVVVAAVLAVGLSEALPVVSAVLLLMIGRLALMLVLPWTLLSLALVSSATVPGRSSS